MIPFDVEHAGVSYQMLTETKTECKVLAAVLPGPILAEYEAAVRQAGYEPGAVLPSSLAALGAIDSPEACFDRQPGRAGAHHIDHRTARICCFIAPSTCPKSPACAWRRCGARQPWPPPTLRTSWAPPRRLYYAGRAMRTGGGNSAAEEFARLDQFVRPGRLTR
jgi:hypothetical protein